MAEFTARIALDDTDFESGRVRVEEGSREMRREFEGSVGGSGGPGGSGGGGIIPLAAGAAGAIVAIGVAAVAAGAAIHQGFQYARGEIEELHQLLPDLRSGFRDSRIEAAGFANTVRVELFAAYETLRGTIAGTGVGGGLLAGAQVTFAGALAEVDKYLGTDLFVGYLQKRISIEEDVREAVESRLADRRLRVESDVARARGDKTEALLKREELLNRENLRRLEQEREALAGLPGADGIDQLEELEALRHRLRVEQIKAGDEGGDRQFRGVQTGLVSASSRDLLARLDGGAVERTRIRIKQLEEAQAARRTLEQIERNTRDRDGTARFAP